jgi:hypothetical protein
MVFQGAVQEANTQTEGQVGDPTLQEGTQPTFATREIIVNLPPDRLLSPRRRRLRRRDRHRDLQQQRRLLRPGQRARPADLVHPESVLVPESSVPIARRRRLRRGRGLGSARGCARLRSTVEACVGRCGALGRLPGRRGMGPGTLRGREGGSRMVRLPGNCGVLAEPRCAGRQR